MIVNKEYLEKKFGKKIEDINFNIPFDKIVKDMSEEDMEISFEDIKGLHGVRMTFNNDVCPVYKIIFSNCNIGTVALEGNVDVKFIHKNIIEVLEMNRGYDADICVSNESDVRIQLLKIYRNSVSFYGAGILNVKKILSFRGHIDDLKVGSIKIDEITGTNKDCYSIVPSEGSFIGYKKLSIPNPVTGMNISVVAKIEILEDSLRTSHLSRKYRASKIKVLDIYDYKGFHYDVAENIFKKYADIKYEIGKTYEVENFDTNRYHQCTTGIHFFLTEQEAWGY